MYYTTVYARMDISQKISLYYYTNDKEQTD